MERFPNFPQTIDPVESETILEQFLELNNNVEKINQGYNELAPQVDTNTTDIEQLKTQVSESGTRVSVNGVLQAEWSPDEITEDVEQLRLAQSSDSLAIVGLQSDNITNKQNISNLQGDVSELNQESARALKTPMSAPTTTELVGVDSTNSQVMIDLDNALSTTSENPVQNKVITSELEKKANKNEVLYNFSSGNSSINLGLTAGIYTNTPVTIPNLRDYNRIRIYTNLASAGLDFIFECLVNPNYEKLTGYTAVTASGKYMRVFNVTTNGVNNTLTLTRMGSYTFPQFAYTNELGIPDGNRIAKIIGIKEDL